MDTQLYVSEDTKPQNVAVINKYLVRGDKLKVPVCSHVMNTLLVSVNANTNINNIETGEWRKLHNKELNDLYSLPNIVRVVIANSIKFSCFHNDRREWLCNMYYFSPADWCS